MKKIKVFVIEDVWSIIAELRLLLEADSFEIIPSRNESNEGISEDYTNQNNLQYIYESDDYLNRFIKIIELITDIDIFIVDLSLTRSGKDFNGKAIL
jgi:hypothetical protein